MADPDAAYPGQHAHHMFDEHVPPPPTRDPRPMPKPPNHDAQPVQNAGRSAN